jgi:capsular polysaccharide biosynthesis protein
LTFHGQYQSGLCARALQALAADVPAAPPWKLFISRRARDRPLLNEDRVAEVLRERGFRVVDPGRMSLREQIAVFKGAQIVVGALGAALTNIAFCASGTPVIALTSASFPDTFFWFLAQHPRLDYREIRGTDIAAPGDPQPWNKGFTLTEADIGCLATL